MSIKLEQVEIAARRDKKSIFVMAQLVLRNQIEVPALIVMKDDKVQMERLMKAHEDQLRKSLIHYIYGDLLEPINELAILAQHHLTGMNDAEELKELRSKIDNIMKGIQIDEK